MKLLTSTLTASYFCLSVIEIAQAPYREKEPSVELLRTLYNTSEGSADVSLEFLRIAGAEAERPIRHFFVLRAMAADAAECRAKAKRLFEAIYHFLQDNGYGCHEVDDRVFHQLYSGLSLDEGCLICRDIRKDHTGLLHIPQVEAVHTRAIYDALNGSGCTFSVQITPSKTTAAEAGYLRSIGQLYRNCCDPNVLNLLSQRSAMLHSFSVTMCLSGEKATDISSRLASALDVPTVILPAGKELFSLPEQPWLRNKYTDRQLLLRCKTQHGIGDPPQCGLFTRFAPMEAAQLLSLPMADQGYVGVRNNIFSLLNHSCLWNEKLTVGGPDSMLVGLSPRGLPLYLPYDALARGLGIVGMNGVGKSVLLLSTIQQLRRKGYPVLVLAGAKYEMRKLVRHFPCKLCTPGYDLFPMKLNIFEIPAGSTAARHKSAIVTVLASAVDMPSPLDSLLLCAVDEAYKAFGFQPESTWADGQAFSLRDFLVIYRKMLAHSDYGREVKGNLQAAAHFRLLALLERADGLMDSLHNSFDAPSLCTGLSVVELENLEPCDRKLAAFFILTSVAAYVKTLPETDGKLRLAIVVDEAHALLSGEDDVPDAGRLAGRAIRNLMVDMISTMRSRGIGLIYSDQSANRIGGNTLFDQTVTKLLFRLEGEEHRLVSGALHFNDKEAKALLNLGVGQCLLKSDLDTEVIGVTTVFREYGANVPDEELRLLTTAGKPKTSPAQIATGLLEEGPSPRAVFHTLNALDKESAQAVARDLESRAAARGVPMPKEYREVMHRYFRERND